MLQLHLSDQQFYNLPRCVLYYRLNGNTHLAVVNIQSGYIQQVVIITKILPLTFWIFNIVTLENIYINHCPTYQTVRHPCCCKQSNRSIENGSNMNFGQQKSSWMEIILKKKKKVIFVQLKWTRFHEFNQTVMCQCEIQWSMMMNNTTIWQYNLHDDWPNS